MVSAYLLGAVCAAAGGLSLRKASAEDKDGQALCLQIRGFEVPLKPFLGLLGAIEATLLIDKATFAAYLDSPQAFLLWALPFLLLGLLLDWSQGALSFAARRFLLVACVAVLLGSAFGPSLAPMGPDPGLTLLFVLLAAGAAYGLYLWRDAKNAHGKVAATLTFVALILPMIAGTLTPAYPAQNPLFLSLQANQTSGDPDHTVENTTEIRVISWELATAYLHRAYGEAAAYLDTDDDTLRRYTDPSYVNGRFVWVNVPVFETWKWLGDRDHTSFAYIENVPEKMGLQEPNVLHRVNASIDFHMERIEWSKRIAQRLFERYNDYVVVQSRFDVDDSLRPYIVVYLAKVPAFFAMPYIEKILIVDVQTGADAEFAVGDAAIPAWMEVVYPDWYVYEWVSFWAHGRFGWGYTVTNKQHLYEPDDVSARFLVINGTTYWQVPLVQQDSNVLGGYVTVETRTGKAVFYNREVRSYADMETATTQVGRYLTSGELGFQHLDIQEGYLYPFRQTNGNVREAYVFPLYAGFSILKYAILDAQEYTSPPVIAESLEVAVAQYRARLYGVPGGGGATFAWESWPIQNAYVGKDPSSSQEEAVITLDNTTYVVTAQELGGGNLARGDDEWRELNLAIAQFARTSNETVWVTRTAGALMDIDWDGATLVSHA